MAAGDNNEVTDWTDNPVQKRAFSISDAPESSMSKSNIITSPELSW
jgi:hypothetical protein